jgi:hypothetical protein
MGMHSPLVTVEIQDGIRTMLRIGLVMTLHPSKGRAVNPHGFIEAGQQYQYLADITNPCGFTRIRMDSCPKRRTGWHC